MPDAPFPISNSASARGAWTVALGDVLPDTPQTLSASAVGTLDPLAPGTTLHGYKILGVLGRGGFGITYQAREGASGREVAIKEFFPVGCTRHLQPDGSWVIEPTSVMGSEAFEMARAQFLEGARALIKIRHASLARVWEVFESSHTAYLVMEMLAGRTLQECISEHGALDEAGAIHLARAVGEAVATMHRLEFLHLDIKPENVMLCPQVLGGGSDTPSSTWGQRENARVVLFDFDLLQRIEKSASLGTRPLTSHCGTPGYAPLEQYAQQATLGAFSDVYALGATLFFLLTAQDPPASADRALADQKFDPRIWRAELSEEVASSISWAMEMSPRARPTSVEEWLPSLEQGRPQAPQVLGAPVVDDSDAGFLSNAPLAPTANALAASGSTWSGGASIGGAPSLPVAPALPPLPVVDGWFQIAARDVVLDWPHSCACCGRKPDVSLKVRAGKSRWGVPYCSRCSRHVKAAHQASAGTAWGIIGGVAVAFVGWAVSDFWIGPIGVAIHFSSLAYGALKVQAAEALMRPRCCDRKHAVGFGGERHTRAGIKYLVRFRSLKYAHEWKSKNASKL